MKRIIIPSLLIMTVLLSCNTTEPPPLIGSINISEIDAAIIETYLNIQIENPSVNREVVIERNGQRVFSFAATNTDTAITDTGLTENATYKYKAKLTENGKLVSESSEVGITTMQSTSHNFTWQTFTFGEHSSSSLYDVAIIDENNIWAVGEIYMKDSTGEIDLNAYNAVHWDGTKWELKRIYYYGSCSLVKYPPLKSIWAFSEDNIIITNGGSIGWFNGNIVNLDCEINPLLTGAINKLWGSSPNSVYAVGNGGNIVFYNGSSWQKIDSGTDTRLRDFASTTNNKLWLSGYSSNYMQSILLSLENNTVTKIWEREGTSTNPYGDIIQSIWGKDNRLYIVSNDGVFLKHTTMNLPDKKLSFNPIWKYRITGTDHNDIYTTGDNSVIMHYNGKDWKEVYRWNNNLSIQYSAASKNNIMVSVGTVVQDAIYHKASIIILKRN